MEAWREELYLQHHGINGQKWGVRNGPPYPLSYGDHSSAEKAYLSKNKNGKYSVSGVRFYNREIVADTRKIYKKNKSANKDEYRLGNISKNEYKKNKKANKEAYIEQIKKDRELQNKAIANMSVKSILTESAVSIGSMAAFDILNKTVMHVPFVSEFLEGGMAGMALAEAVNLGMHYVYKNKENK